MCSSHRLLLLLFSFFSFPSQIIIKSQAAEEEKQILLQIKADWNNPLSLSSWSNSTSTSSHCNWEGIQCNINGSVTAISLTNRDISGEVPNITCFLHSLSTLDLSNNFIGGEFPTTLYNCTNLQILNLSQNIFVGQIPADVHRLSGLLLVLDISSNNFSGEIPATIGKFPRLQRLGLDNNLFVGSFPKEISNILTLERLTLANNPFTTPAKIPPEFANLRKLKYLWMSEVRLIGGIPETFANLTELEYLDLSINQLNGTIPTAIWSLKNLKFLYLYKNNLLGAIKGSFSSLGLLEIDLSKNQLTGPIPEEFGTFQKLQVLLLYFNQLSGEVPASIAKIPALIDVRLFNNRLTGALPPEFGMHSKLLNFEVTSNQLSGEFPQNICAGAVLNTLAAAENNFTGKLPESLGNCSGLVTIRVEKNGFSGVVPAGIWSLGNLDAVLMHDNALSGELPDVLPGNLLRLEIGNNRFYGSIPSAAANLLVFKASNNVFSGDLPANFSGLSNLQDLSLDKNQITGEIPSAIGSLNSLYNLDLGNNKLTGRIPGTIGRMQVLTSLDLSDNRLTGEIPGELGSLKLDSFNLSSNLLAGQIPPSLQNQAYDRSFLSNPGLCSSTPLWNLPPCSPKLKSSKELPKSLLTLFLILGIFVFLAAVFFGWFLFVRDSRRRKNADLASWKLTSFHSPGFTESSIVKGITVEHLIGSGGSGQVYRVPVRSRLGEDVVVAVKKIRNSTKLDSRLERAFDAEVEILSFTRHSNIVKLLCCVSSADSKLLVYEYMPNGSLHQWLHGEKKNLSPQPLDWPVRMRIALGAARGLCYMHHECSPAIVHRDVKSGNILLDADFRPKVADFGLARILSGDSPETTGVSASVVAGSLGYMAPECAYGRKVSEKVDVYSFGVVLLELVTGKEASDHNGDGSSLAEWAWRRYQEGSSVVMADVVDERVRDVVMYMEEISAVFRLGIFCTGTLPSTRPTMKDVLQVLVRCERTKGLFRGDDEKEKYNNSGGGEYDVAPLLRNISGGGRNSRRNRGDSDEDEKSVASNV